MRSCTTRCGWRLALWPRKSKVGFKPAGMQIVGMIGLTQNIRRTSGWAIRMMFGRIRRLAKPPRGTIPIRSVLSGEALSKTRDDPG